MAYFHTDGLRVHRVRWGESAVTARLLVNRNCFGSTKSAYMNSWEQFFDFRDRIGLSCSLVPRRKTSSARTTPSKRALPFSA